MDNNLKAILDEQGIMVSWLAKQVGVHRNTITRTMEGSIPHLDLAYRIAKALNKSVYDIWPAL